MEVEVIKAKTNFDNSAAVGRKDRLRVAAWQEAINHRLFVFNFRTTDD